MPIVYHQFLLHRPFHFVLTVTTDRHLLFQVVQLVQKGAEH